MAELLEPMVNPVGTTHKCNHPKCEIKIPNADYACRSHWFSLPSDIRNRIRGAFKARKVRSWAAASLEARKFWKKRIEARE